MAGPAAAVGGSELHQLNFTRGIRIDDNGTLYVADSYNSRIVLIRPSSTTAVAVVGTGQGSRDSQLWYPADIFITQSSIYVMDTMNYRVQKWSRKEEVDKTGNRLRAHTTLT